MDLEQATYYFNSLLLVSSADNLNIANSLNRDQARQNIGPILDPICLILWWHS